MRACVCVRVRVRASSVCVCVWGFGFGWVGGCACTVPGPAFSGESQFVLCAANGTVAALENSANCANTHDLVGHQSPRRVFHPASMPNTVYTQRHHVVNCTAHDILCKIL